MVRLSKIYTKVGDSGQTMLASGDFVSKAHGRIEAYGTVDELNAAIGFLRDTIVREGASAKVEVSIFADQIKAIQNELFDLGAELATPSEKINTSRQTLLTNSAIERLEVEMDRMNERLAPLMNFVLPGGCLCNSAAHLARTVCRRAERATVRLGSQEPLRDEAYIYLNRLSDWLFVVSRELSRCLGADEVLWDQKKPGT